MEELNLFSNGGDVAHNNKQMAHYLCDLLEKYLDGKIDDKTFLEMLKYI